ncbi:uncharacterized protein [Nicotiana sylvestris]|uniref:uncharacterized protein n=1 Tax=Nicotiana sylvestris TaxID=4096 RepID=UPI00388C6F99
MGTWKSSGAASGMWTVTVNCIKEAARAVLGVTKCSSGGRKWDWWWSTEVQGKVEAKKVAYLHQLESVDKEEKKTNSECYKIAKKEAKLAVIMAKTVAFEHCMKNLEENEGIRSCTD